MTPASTSGSSRTRNPRRSASRKTCTALSIRPLGRSCRLPMLACNRLLAMPSSGTPISRGCGSSGPPEQEAEIRGGVVRADIHDWARGKKDRLIMDRDFRRHLLDGDREAGAKWGLTLASLSPTRRGTGRPWLATCRPSSSCIAITPHAPAKLSQRKLLAILQVGSACTQVDVTSRERRREAAVAPVS